MCIILSCVVLALDSSYLQVSCWEGQGRTLSHHLLIRVKLNMITFLEPSKKYGPLFHVEHRSVYQLALLDKID